MVGMGEGSVWLGRARRDFSIGVAIRRGTKFKAMGCDVGCPSPTGNSAQIMIIVVIIWNYTKMKLKKFSIIWHAQ